MLTGLATCATCGGALTARTSGKARTPAYYCLTNMSAVYVCQPSAAVIGARDRPPALR
jgi:Recombinase zinc beta ribbon domain